MISRPFLPHFLYLLLLLLLLLFFVVVVVVVVLLLSLDIFKIFIKITRIALQMID